MEPTYADKIAALLTQPIQFEIWLKGKPCHAIVGTDNLGDDPLEKWLAANIGSKSDEVVNLRFDRKKKNPDAPLLTYLTADVFIPEGEFCGEAASNPVNTDETDPNMRWAVFLTEHMRTVPSNLLCHKDGTFGFRSDQMIYLLHMALAESEAWQKPCPTPPRSLHWLDKAKWYADRGLEVPPRKDFDPNELNKWHLTLDRMHQQEE